MANEEEEKDYTEDIIEETKDRAQRAIDGRVKDLQRLSDNVYLTLETFQLRLKTVTGFMESLNIWDKLPYDSNDLDNQTIIDTQADGIEMLDKLMDGMADVNLYEYSKFLDKFIDEEFYVDMYDENRMSVLKEAAKQLMHQTICRAMDDPLRACVECAEKSEKEIDDCLSKLSELQVPPMDWPEYTKDNGELYLCPTGEDI